MESEASVNSYQQLPLGLAIDLLEEFDEPRRGVGIHEKPALRPQRVVGFAEELLAGGQRGEIGEGPEQVISIGLRAVAAEVIGPLVLGVLLARSSTGDAREVVLRIDEPVVLHEAHETQPRTYATPTWVSVSSRHISNA